MLKIINVAQWGEIDVASCVHEHDPEDIFS
jgi:hypothetical protein